MFVYVLKYIMALVTTIYSKHLWPAVKVLLDGTQELHEQSDRVVMPAVMWHGVVNFISPTSDYQDILKKILTDSGVDLSLSAHDGNITIASALNGFVTQRGTFISAAVALQVAVGAGQIVNKNRENFLTLELFRSGL